MRIEEFEDFLAQHQDLEWTGSSDDQHMLFRDPTWPWYQREGNITKIAKSKFVDMTPDDLEHAIYDGVKVEQITRITGYFTKLSSWNPGKRAELKARKRCDENFQTKGSPGAS